MQQIYRCRQNHNSRHAKVFDELYPLCVQKFPGRSLPGGYLYGKSQFLKTGISAGLFSEGHCWANRSRIHFRLIPGYGSCQNCCRLYPAFGQTGNPCSAGRFLLAHSYYLLLCKYAIKSLDSQHKFFVQPVQRGTTENSNKFGLRAGRKWPGNTN